MKVAKKDFEKCRNCGFCDNEIACLGIEECVGCGACVSACPLEARKLVEIDEERPQVNVLVDGEEVTVRGRATTLEVLKYLGYEVSIFPGEGDIHAPCRTGGCYSCAVLVDGVLKPSCITPIEEGMKISTDTTGVRPKRVISGFQGHTVGGVGTPYGMKIQGAGKAIEVACFAHGCILRCPTCQNWRVTYSSSGRARTPKEAAELMTSLRKKYEVDRMAISGGECTLNKDWLLSYVEEVDLLNPDREARTHVDTNAVVLTPDYLDELVDRGMTDIGIDLKAHDLRTFSRITGVYDEEIAKIMLDNLWQAFEYAVEEFWPDIFVGVGIPYNSGLTTLDEIREIGNQIAEIEPKVQVFGLDYRPEFRRRKILRPSMEEMLEVKRVLEESGLECVICQTSIGHIGPS